MYLFLVNTFLPRVAAADKMAGRNAAILSLHTRSLCWEFLLPLVNIAYLEYILKVKYQAEISLSCTLKQMTF